MDEILQVGMSKIKPDLAVQSGLFIPGLRKLRRVQERITQVYSRVTGVMKPFGLSVNTEQST